MPIDTLRLDVASAALVSRSSRLIGWGSGSVFDYFHELHPVRLDYLVDNDHSAHGQRRRGIEIVSPECLAQEPPESTFVVIYSSAWPEIQRQLAQLGTFASLPASAVFAEPAARARLAWSEQLAARPRAARRRSGNAIVVQGPIVPAVTERVLRVMTALHPDAAVILSTWRDTEPQLLADASAIADDVVVSERPENAGIQNRNLQIVSTAAGITLAMATGATTILKTRTDLAVLSPFVFDQARRLLDRVDRSGPRDAGLRDRIIVPSSYTRAFLLYHASDLVMLGAAEDLAKYWAAPLDRQSPGDQRLAGWAGGNIAAMNTGINPAESYLGTQFCRTIGRPATGTLSDSWAFYRDLFAVVDNDWFDLLWFKHLSMPDVTMRRGIRQLVSHQFWERLVASDPALDREKSA